MPLISTIRVPPRVAVLVASARAQLVDRVDQGDDVVDRRARQDAVSQVEDVPRATRDFVEDAARLFADVRRVGVERYGVEVALDRKLREASACLSDRHTVIDAEHLAAAARLQIEQRGG